MFSLEHVPAVFFGYVCWDSRRTKQCFYKKHKDVIIANVALEKFYLPALLGSVLKPFFIQNGKNANSS